MLKTKTRGAVKKISLPERFVVDRRVDGGMGDNWESCFHPLDQSGVSIFLYYRGRPISGEDAEAFRSLLERQPHEIFSLSSAPFPSAAAVTLFLQLAEALGNAGNNQLINREGGIRGPRFFLEQAETFDLRGRRVLCVRGHFHGPDREPHNYFCGIFFDSATYDKDCRVEELILQAETESLFDQYYPLFRQSIETIEWS